MRIWNDQNFTILLVGIQIGTVTLENSVAISSKVTSYDPVILILPECDSHLYTSTKKLVQDVHINIVRAKYYKQHQYPSRGEWINKLWHITTMEFYTAGNMNELELYVLTWINLMLKDKKHIA